MAFPAQFQLGLEITNLVPVRSIIRTGAELLAYQIRKSGSDVYVEDSLAEVFGRSKIQDQFESSFRQVLLRRTENKHHVLSEYLDLALEIGIGPTVRRCLHSSNPAHFSTVVQLSMLQYAHNAESFARGLARALENRASANPNAADVPNHQILRGVLTACSEQTSAYPWSRLFDAVEGKLSFANNQMPWKPYQARSLPFSLLQGVVDLFPAVQYFPDDAVVRIRTYEGISTLVVWAYSVLGLSTTVLFDGNVIRFGNGPEKIFIESSNAELANEPPSVTFFRSSEMQFSISTVYEEDPLLSGVFLRSAGGYGAVALREFINDPVVVREVAHKVLASCLLYAREASDHFSHHLQPAAILIPNYQRILDAATLIFGPLDYFHELGGEMLAEPCIVRGNWQQNELPALLSSWLSLSHSQSRQGTHPPIQSVEGVVKTLEDSGRVSTIGSEAQPSAVETKPHVRETMPSASFPPAFRESRRPSDRWPPVIAADRSLQKVLMRLFRLVFIFAAVRNTKDCEDLPLDIYGCRDSDLPDLQYHHVFSIPTSFELLSQLLQGSQYDVSRLKKASIVSNMGWSIVLGSTKADLPSRTPPDLTVIRGVPSKNNERKNAVLDGLPNFQTRSSRSTGYYPKNPLLYKSVAKPGQKTRLKSFHSEPYFRPMVSVDVKESAFEAFWILKAAVRGADPELSQKTSYLGIRKMQDLVWNSVCLPPCEHSTSDEIRVPDHCLVFQGWTLDNDGWTAMNRVGRRSEVSTKPQETVPSTPAPPILVRYTAIDDIIEQFMDGFEGHWRDWVHLSPVGNEAFVSWMMLLALEDWATYPYDEEKSRTNYQAEKIPVQAYVRDQGCCIDCAVHMTKNHQHDGVKVLIA